MFDFRIHIGLQCGQVNERGVCGRSCSPDYVRRFPLPKHRFPSSKKYVPQTHEFICRPITSGVRYMCKIAKCEESRSGRKIGNSGNVRLGRVYAAFIPFKFPGSRNENDYGVVILPSTLFCILPVVFGTNEVNYGRWRSIPIVTKIFTRAFSPNERT